VPNLIGRADQTVKEILCDGSLPTELPETAQLGVRYRKCEDMISKAERKRWALPGDLNRLMTRSRSLIA